jgi:hypothetical protein
MFEYTSEQLQERYGVTAEELKAKCKGVLEYMVDYRPRRAGGLVFTDRAMCKLDGAHGPKDDPKKDAMYESDSFVWARVAGDLPPNPRRVWVIVEGADQKGVCNMPQRYAKGFRVPGKRIPVRHVADNVYQIVVPKWNDITVGRVIGDEEA